MVDSKINVLIVIPSPREIAQVIDAINALDSYDRLWIKNYSEYEAYQEMRRYFLENKQYDYLAIAPDDMVLDKVKFERLVDDLDSHASSIPVLCGVANRELKGPYAEESTVSIKHLPDIRAWNRKYFCESMSGLKKVSDSGFPIIQVAYAGFPCMIIRRDVIQKTSLATDGEYNGESKGTGCCIDVVFCNECSRLKIPIYCDTRCDFVHLKVNDGVAAKAAHAATKRERKLVLMKRTREE